LSNGSFVVGHDVPNVTEGGVFHFWGEHVTLATNGSEVP